MIEIKTTTKKETNRLKSSPKVRNTKNKIDKIKHRKEKIGPIKTTV